MERVKGDERESKCCCVCVSPVFFLRHLCLSVGVRRKDEGG